jgi:hypothetical protein
MIRPRYKTVLAVFAFCLALAGAFYFGYRAARTARHVRWQNEPIRAWMSVPFIAHTHHASEEVLFQAIHLPPNPKDRRPIRQIAREEHVPPADLIRELQSALDKAPK